MPAVATQQLATTADLDLHGPPVAALSMFSTAQKDAHLRRASGEVLAAYAKRYNVVESEPLVSWGDFTIGLVVDLAAYTMMVRRGFNPDSKIDKTIVDNRDRAIVLLDEIADLTNKNARQDPDVIDATTEDEMGPLAYSEGGDLDEADAWAHAAAVIP